MAPPAKYTDEQLARQVLISDALRRRYRRNAAPYRQVRLAEALDVPQSTISKVVKGTSTDQLTDEQKAWVHEQTFKRRYWDSYARRHRPRTVCQRLGICLRTYHKITAQHRAEPAPERSVDDTVRSFLTRRLVA